VSTGISLPGKIVSLQSTQLPLWQSGYVAELDSNTRSIQSIYGTLYSAGKLVVNRRYQRKLVWTLEEKQKLVESVLNRYPIPAILLAERDSGEYEVIDGLQRLHALISYIEGAFSSPADLYFDVSKFATAQARADEGIFKSKTDNLLSVKAVSTFLDYSLSVSVMRDASELEIDDVFGRINSYGHRLSDQERRQAGVKDKFADMIRELACEFRGDTALNIVELSQMPQISIDLPMTKHGYGISAENVFWVREGILTSTDLRDSLDEQCLADLSAIIVGGQMITRSKEALNDIYDRGSAENLRINTALTVYGQDKFKAQLNYCIDELLKICADGNPVKLRSLLFTKRTSNAFSSVFVVLVIALHEALVAGSNKISDYAAAKKALTGVGNSRIDTGRGSVLPSERRKNIDTIKGLLSKSIVPVKPPRTYSAQRSVIDIDAIIQRSIIELPHYELKQGLLALAPGRTVDHGVISKVVETICAIANNGPRSTGDIIIGVTDKPADAERIKMLDGILPREVGNRSAVGIVREAKILGESIERYVNRWRDGIRNSELSEPLRSSVLSAFDYSNYFGLGLIVLRIPNQNAPSFVGDDLFFREADQTIRAKTAKEIANVASRFT
jgi:hypothetical protein